MIDKNQQQREAVVCEARTWLNTRFHHRAAVKGAGVDCMMFPASTYTSVLGAAFRIPPYSPQWHLHAEGDVKHPGAQFPDFPAYVPVGKLWTCGEDRFRELYIEGLLNGNFIEISGGRTNVEPFDSGRFLESSFGTGDIVLVKLARTYAHGAIILQWPRVIQAESAPMGAGKVVESTVEANWFFTQREMKFFSWKEWH